MSDDSDSLETWTTSYGDRCIENEQSLQDILLESTKKKYTGCKKYITFVICTLGIIGISCLLFFLFKFCSELIILST